MKTKSNHWKIGLFVLASLAFGFAAIAWLGARRLDRDTQSIVCYFNESVQGLEVGSPVKMRGVSIGTVTAIGFAIDRRHVEVHWDIYTDVVGRLGLSNNGGGGVSGEDVSADLRVQLATTGITGAKFLLVDFFESDVVPLPFDPPRNHVPTVPSTLKSMEDGLMVFLDALPATMENLERIGASLAREIERTDVSALTRDLRVLVGRMDETLAAIDADRLEEDLHALMGELRTSATSLREGVDEWRRASSGVDELIAGWSEVAHSVDSAIEEAAVEDTGRAVREAAHSYEGLALEASAMGTDAQELVVELRETLRSLRALASYLERDPGALLRGRSESEDPR